MRSNKPSATSNQSTHQTLLGHYRKLVRIEERFLWRNFKGSTRQLLVQKGKLRRYLLQSTFSVAQAVHKGAPSRQRADCRNNGCARSLFRSIPFLDEGQAAAAGTQQLQQSDASRGAPE